jgi:L-lactate permease
VTLNVILFISFPTLISNYKYSKKALVKASNYINLLGFLPKLVSSITAFFFYIFLVGFKGDLAAVVLDLLSFAVFTLPYFVVSFFIGSDILDINISLVEVEVEAEVEDVILSALVIGGVLAEVR